MASQRFIKAAMIGGLIISTGLTACGPNPVGGGGGVTAQGQSSASLELRFQIPEQQPEYLAKIQEIEIRVFSRGQQTRSDRFDFALASSSSEVRRSIENVPTGAIELQVRLLDNQGEEIQSLNSQFTFSSNSESVLIVLNQSAQIIPPVAISGSLTEVRKQRLETLNEIQRLSQEESRLQIQVRGLVNAQTPEDKVIREQYQAELQTTQSKLSQAEATLANQNNALQRLEAQSASGGGGVAIDTSQLLLLRQQSDSLRSEIEALMNQRRQLNSELRNAEGTRQDQIQGEVQSLSLQIDAKITALSGINTQLLALESQLTGQSAGPEISDPAELTQVNQQIQTLEAEIATLNQQIQLLLQQTDFQSVQRRERFEADLTVKQAELAQAQARKKQLEAQI